MNENINFPYYSISLNKKQYEIVTNESLDSKKLILDSDIIILMTDWKNLKKLKKDFKNINLSKKVIIDPHGLLRYSFENKCKKYFTLGRKNEI